METMQETIEIREYRPDGGFTMAGALTMGAGLVLAGIILGVAAHYVARAIWLILIFPLGIGLVLGLVATWATKANRVRNPAVAGVLGLAAGFAAMFVMHYQDYGRFRSAIAQLPPEFRRLAALPREQRATELREGLSPEEIAGATRALELASVNNMLDYMNMEAKEGVRIGKPGRSGSGINLGFTGTWIYWSIEVVIVAGITWAMAKSAAGEPFCVGCQQWKPYGVLGYFTGSAGDVELALTGGSVAKLKGLGPVPGETNLALWVARCPKCGAEGEVQLKLEETIVNGKGEKTTKTLLRCTTPGTSVAALQPLFAPAAPAPSLAAEAVPAVPVAGEQKGEA